MGVDHERDPLLLQMLQKMQGDIQRLEDKVDAMNAWKMRVIGGSAVLAGVASGAMTLVLHFLK